MKDLIQSAKEGVTAPFDSTNPSKSQAQKVAVTYLLIGLLISRVLA